LEVVLPTAAATVRIQRLRALRTARGLSQTELAEMAGTSQPVVSLVERGFSTAATLERLARALGVPGDPRSLMDIVSYEEVRRTAAAPASQSLVVP
jgi:transcriptional regulator with XRE-family HTH domain